MLSRVRASHSLCRGMAVLALALLLGPLTLAIQPPEESAAQHGLASRAFVSPTLQVEPTLDMFPAASSRAQAFPGLKRFTARHASAWEVRWDLRSDRPHLLQGVGVPLLPGAGNTMHAEQAGLTPGVAPSLADVEVLVRRFLADTPELLRVDGFDLRLDDRRSVHYGDDDYFWVIELQQYHDDLPVQDAYVFFRINHGNIVQLGTNRVAAVALDTAPAITADQAFTLALATAGIAQPVAEMIDEGSLAIYPAMDPGEALGERYAGPAGTGYQHLLVWQFAFKLVGSEEIYRFRVDAHNGALLEFLNDTRFATVSGHIYPTTNTDPLVNVPLPFTTVSNNGNQITDASGEYNYTGGTATAQLNGRYVRISDNCGGISLADSTNGNLDFGGSAGTDCTTPGFGGAGNTHAARSGFYHLTNINRKAATFLPTNNWIDGTLTANMNINLTCNANWNGSQVNFYRSGGGCSNTGEIAAVFLHEWGHGMDDNSGGSANENGSGEALGDTFAFLETRDACIGRNFTPGNACDNCDPSCTGVRDVAAFANGGSSTIARPDTVESNSGINCDAFVCPYSIFGIFPYRGPMGYEGHCESYIASGANWDLAQALIAEYGTDPGWAAMDNIWYSSLVPSKSAYRVASGGQCNPSATVDGCAATNWYTVYLAADDDDGNLANGTPNGCRIWDAFNDHGIACGTQPACSGLSPNIFTDGFESGDTSAWSAAVP